MRGLYLLFLLVNIGQHEAGHILACPAIPGKSNRSVGKHTQPSHNQFELFTRTNEKPQNRTFCVFAQQRIFGRLLKAHVCVCVINTYELDGYRDTSVI